MSTSIYVPKRARLESGVGWDSTDATRAGGWSASTPTAGAFGSACSLTRRRWIHTRKCRRIKSFGEISVGTSMYVVRGLNSPVSRASLNASHWRRPCGSRARTFAFNWPSGPVIELRQQEQYAACAACMRGRMHQHDQQGAFWLQQPAGTCAARPAKLYRHCCIMSTYLHRFHCHRRTRVSFCGWYRANFFSDGSSIKGLCDGRYTLYERSTLRRPAQFQEQPCGLCAAVGKHCQHVRRTRSRSAIVGACLQCRMLPHLAPTCSVHRHEQARAERCV